MTQRQEETFLLIASPKTEQGSHARCWCCLAKKAEVTVASGSGACTGSDKTWKSRVVAFVRMLERLHKRELQFRLATRRRLAQEQFEGRNGSFEEELEDVDMETENSK